jgi:hypothetical protein
MHGVDIKLINGKQAVEIHQYKNTKRKLHKVKTNICCHIVIMCNQWMCEPLKMNTKWVRNMGRYCYECFSVNVYMSWSLTIYKTVVLGYKYVAKYMEKHI